MSFLSEIEAAIKKSKKVDKDFPGHHIAFLRDMLYLNSQKGFPALLAKHELKNEDLDEVKATITKLKIVASSCQEWMVKVSEVDSVEGQGADYL